MLFLLYGTAGAILAVLGGILWFGVARVPDLKPWHTATLHSEFSRADSSRVHDLDGYRRLEDRLFEELRVAVYERVGEADRRALNRYSSGSLADPTGYPDNGNRTYELPAAEPRAAVLMIHGLTDSPYVLRALGERLHQRGCWVVGLRLPGHGTAPSALKSVRWEDWAAAVRLAARDMRRRAGPNVPLYFVGFSTGAALSVEYALARLEGEDLPAVTGLVLLSPAIGVDPLAWLAHWQARLSAIPGLGKLAWLDVVPEYDPYKYNSFAVNAGDQIYSLTRVIDQRITKLSGGGPVRGFPRTLVFQSVADATVSPPAVIDIFLNRLAPEGHELVAFDINRLAAVEPLLRPDARRPSEMILTAPAWPFDATLITNQDDESPALVALHWMPQGTEVRREPTGLVWPPGLFALSHVSMPIRPDDQIYGAERPQDRRAIYLGNLELRGEQGLLTVPPNALVRLRFNPFFSYVETRTIQFLGLADDVKSR